MWSQKIFLILGCILQSHLVLSIWTCSADVECSLPAGSVCQAGACVCAPEKQLVLGGTVCADSAPYFTSSCLDNYQCSNLLTNFKCVYDNDETVGQCGCQPGYYYYIGRCWKAVDFGGQCDRNEECFGTLRDPYNMVCEEGRCACSPGYYERQRGECRKSGQAVGEGCILDEDCRFPNGVCHPGTFTCYDSNNPPAISALSAVVTTADIAMTSNLTSSALVRSHGAACSATSGCPQPFLCSQFGACVCPRGYYPNEAGSTCFAELGTTSTEDQCGGFLAEVIDGVCGCPANVYFDESMRDCVKATRRITDSCVNDQMCHTFGAASRCGPAQTWGFRNCECIPEHAVWDADRGICRLFAGVGENCEVDSDCLAGNQEIQCIADSEGQGICTCPEGTTNIEGLCLTSGLSLGDECQMTQECTETANTVCEEGRCSCGLGYQERDEICAPTISSPCQLDADCAIENTVCVAHSDTFSTCQCNKAFLEYDDACWQELEHYTSECDVMLQCMQIMGVGSNCTENQCHCTEDYHFRDGRCWPRIGLFGECSRSSECYLGELSNRVQCRNSLCQCSFDYPYSEELHTCTGGEAGYAGSSASVIVSSTFTVALALIYYIMLN